MRSVRAAALALLSLAGFWPLPPQPLGSAVPADGGADNVLTDREQADGWLSLFGGTAADQWLIGGEPIPAANVRDGTINPRNVGAGRKLYVMYTRRRFADFVLTCDFKVSRECNSGIFLRESDPADPVQTGIEVQLSDSAGKRALGKHDSGGIYDALAPSADAMKPAGEWNHIEITARGPKVEVVLNGRRVIDADLTRWDTPGRNPDGSKNKFTRALRDFPREGHIGLQDHLSDVWFKNLKVRPLAPGRPDAPATRPATGPHS
jgi:hypothetical protein